MDGRRHCRDLPGAALYPAPVPYRKAENGGGWQRYAAGARPYCRSLSGIHHHQNTGGGPISRVVVADPEGHTVELSKNLSLPVGATLKINMEPPIGAEIISGGAAANALKYAVRFDPLRLKAPGRLAVTLSGQALVTATARGCMV